MKFYNDIIGLVGKTPLVKVNNLTKEHKIKAQVFAKMESLNPGYSVKDRIGVSMIDWAEKEGVLKKGGTIIEATSGNTGIGLALVAAVRGYRCVFVLTEKASVEKVRYLKGLGQTSSSVRRPQSRARPTITLRPPSAYRSKRPTRFIQINTITLKIRRRTTERRDPRYGKIPMARSHILSQASAPAARSAARGVI